MTVLTLRKNERGKVKMQNNTEYKDKIVAAVQELGWSSPKRIAAAAGVNDAEIRNILDKLCEDSVLTKKPIGRGHQYAIFGTPKDLKSSPQEDKNHFAEKSKKFINQLSAQLQEKDEENLSIDEYMICGFGKINKEQSYCKEGLAIELLNKQGRQQYDKYQIIDNITKMVRFGALELQPYMDGAKRTFRYIPV